MSAWQRAPITKFNGFMIGKIASYLKTKEGCHVERIEYTNDGARAIIQDSFGFRYEIHVETIGRIADAPQTAAEYRCYDMYDSNPQTDGGEEDVKTK